MSENSNEEITKRALQFYDQLSKEKLIEPNKSSTDWFFDKPIKSLKVHPQSVNLNKPLQKNVQNEKDRRKENKLRKKQISPLNLIRKRKGSVSTIHSNKKYAKKIDKKNTSEKEIDSISVSLNKYLKILKKDEFDIKNDGLIICCKPQADGSLLVTLFPNSKLYLIGYYRLQLIIGNISILGYKFKENEEHVVYSPVSHSILSIDCLDGSQLKKLNDQKLKELCIPLEYIEELRIPIEQPVVVLKISRYSSNMTQMFNDLRITFKENKLDMCIWKENLNLQLIENPKEYKHSLFYESEEWKSYVERLQPSIKSSGKKIFVVTGGKNVGKSTFLKYIINRFLSTLKTSSIACLDLDPGQPEFSLPGCLTLTVCKSPILGPSISHHENIYSYQKQILLGDIAVNHLMNEYLNIVSYLFSIYKEQFSSVPLIVNTMGFTAYTGYDIMIDILRIVEPSHVVTIESLKANKNYPTRLTKEIISSTDRGILRNNFKKLNYELSIFKSLSKESCQIKSRLSREINIMGYLSLLWEANEKFFSCHSLKKCLTVNWSNIAIHVHRSSVAATHILLAINASLVALCKIGSEYIYQVDRRHPLKIHYNMSSLRSCECLGWGAVRGIDPLTQEIFIYTPLLAEEFEKVNMIFMPNVHLPVYFRSYFSTTADTPYITK